MKFKKLVKAEMKSNPEVREIMKDIEIRMEKIKNAIHNMVESNNGDLDTLYAIDRELLTPWLRVRYFDDDGK